MENNYEKQATDFLKATKTDFNIKFLRYGEHFHNETDKRDIYEITLKRGERSYKFNFGQSLTNSGYQIRNKNNGKVFKTVPTDQVKDKIEKYGETKYSLGRILDWKFTSCDELVRPEEPTPCDVLSCLEKYPVDSFEDFCANYGYDEDSRSAYKIYEAVKDEWQNIAMLYNDEELEQLREIL